MSKWDLDSFQVEYKGRTFAVTQLGYDISSEWEKPAGTIEVSHKIEGFPITLYMFSDAEDSSFGFGHKVIEDGHDTGLFVTLQDEEMFLEAAELVSYIDHGKGDV